MEGLSNSFEVNLYVVEQEFDRKPLASELLGSWNPCLLSPLVSQTPDPTSSHPTTGLSPACVLSLHKTPWELPDLPKYSHQPLSPPNHWPQR